VSDPTPDPPAQILVVDDVEMNRDLLSRRVRRLGHEVLLAEDGVQAMDTLRKQAVDVVLLDIMMPNMNGYEVLEAMAADVQLQRVPVIMISAIDDKESIARCIELGADDYLTKPFQTEELLARLNALIRRAAGYASPVITQGELRLDTSRKEVRVTETLIELTAYEYKVLEYLMLNPSRVVSKSELTDHLYEQDFDRDSNVIEVFVGRLRKKLAPVNPIRTIRGQGYRFNQDATA